MKKYLQYSPELDSLTEKEQQLLTECLQSVKEFVLNSKEINKTHFATRDAHSKTYAIIEGELIMNEELPDFAKNIFKEEKYSVLGRFSHANPKISYGKSIIPAYGFSIKINKSKNEIINLPLVNFPIFPVLEPSEFLVFFTLLNKYWVARIKNIFDAIFVFSQLIIQSIKLSKNLFNFEFIKHSLSIFKHRKDFILSFSYHSIGVYRLGNYLIKLKVIPDDLFSKFKNVHSPKKGIENYLKNKNISYNLFIQVSENIKQQPINDLTKEWKNAEWLKIGELKFPRQNTQNIHDEIWENINFNPFENPDYILPVGKIQQLRKETYKTSILTRNNINITNNETKNL